MLKKAMSLILTFAIATTFSIVSFGSDEPDLSPVEEVTLEAENIHTIAIWGGVAACAIVVIGLMVWKKKDDDIDW